MVVPPINRAGLLLGALFSTPLGPPQKNFPERNHHVDEQIGFATAAATIEDCRGEYLRWINEGLAGIFSFCKARLKLGNHRC